MTPPYSGRRWHPCTATPDSGLTSDRPAATEAVPAAWQANQSAAEQVAAPPGMRIGRPGLGRPDRRVPYRRQLRAAVGDGERLRQPDRAAPLMSELLGALRGARTARQPNQRLVICTTRAGRRWAGCPRPQPRRARPWVTAQASPIGIQPRAGQRSWRSAGPGASAPTRSLFAGCWDLFVSTLLRR
jgi:hypothetical protein